LAGTADGGLSSLSMIFAFCARLEAFFDSSDKAAIVPSCPEGSSFISISLTLLRKGEKTAP
jgi:hypothetical protein